MLVIFSKSKFFSWLILIKHFQNYVWDNVITTRRDSIFIPLGTCVHFFICMELWKRAFIINLHFTKLHICNCLSYYLVSIRYIILYYSFHRYIDFYTSTCRCYKNLNARNNLVKRGLIILN